MSTDVRFSIKIPSKIVKLGQYRPAIQMAFRWRADSGPRWDDGWVDLYREIMYLCMYSKEATIIPIMFNAL